MAYLICWLDSLRILRISFPLNSNSLVRAFIFSWRCCTSLSKSEMWCSLCLTSSCRSVILHMCSLLWKINSSEKFSTYSLSLLNTLSYNRINHKTCQKQSLDNLTITGIKTLIQSSKNKTEWWGWWKLIVLRTLRCKYM